MTDAPRYFYADPLAAAWMEKHHGMKFRMRYTQDEKDEFGVEDDWYDWHDSAMEEPNTLSEALATLADFRSAYLDPDSLPLLKPCEGDKDDAGYVFSEKTQAWWREDGWTHDGQRTLHAKLPEESRTAQRNGVAFHCPEQEAA